MSPYRCISHLTVVEEKDGVYVASRLYTFHEITEIMKLIDSISKISEIEYAIGIGEAIINDLHVVDTYEFTGRLNTKEKQLVKSIQKFYGSMKIKFDNNVYTLAIEKLPQKDEAYWVVLSSEANSKKDAMKKLNKLALEIELY